MSKKAVIKEKKPLSFVRDILVPACAMFGAVILGIYTFMYLLGFNVTETRDKFTSKYDAITDDYSKEWLVGAQDSLPPMLVIGILIFCFAVFALAYLSYMELDKLSTRLLHFGGTLLAFLLFVLVLSGYASGEQTTFASIMLALVLVGICYFICLAIKLLLRRPTAFVKKKFQPILSRFIAPVTVVFAFLITVCTLLALFITTDIKIGYSEDFDSDNGHLLYESWETLITPLAPTLQNYLRYLGTAAIIVLSLLVFLTTLPKVAKILLNFAVCCVGFFTIWFIQLDFFHELDDMSLISVIFFLALYAVIFTAASVICFILKRRREMTDGYVSQFSPRKTK